MGYMLVNDAHVLDSFSKIADLYRIYLYLTLESGRWLACYHWGRPVTIRLEICQASFLVCLPMVE